MTKIVKADVQNKQVFEVNLTIEDGYFSVTGKVFKMTKKGKADHRSYLMAGAIGDLFAKTFPQYKDICDLHLHDVDGSPMYAVENGLYFIENKKYAADAISSHFNIFNEEATQLRDSVLELETEEERTKFVSDFVESKRNDWKAYADACIKKYNLK